MASTIGGFVVQPTAAVYAATRFAVRAILYAIEQPGDVDVNEIVVRPFATQVRSWIAA
ncbi:hypothetical protein PQR05_09400 [Paraburkholderia sediminicola]|uniref:hypothetical protein n=1 Tax=Paraburkholderia sediminicola TaxID=458836 RepID=UPI0038BA789F